MTVWSLVSSLSAAPARNVPGHVQTDRSLNTLPLSLHFDTTSHTHVPWRDSHPSVAHNLAVSLMQAWVGRSMQRSLRALHRQDCWLFSSVPLSRPRERALKGPRRHSVSSIISQPVRISLSNVMSSCLLALQCSVLHDHSVVATAHTPTAAQRDPTRSAGSASMPISIIALHPAPTQRVCATWRRTRLRSHRLGESTFLLPRVGWLMPLRHHHLS